MIVSHPTTKLAGICSREKEAATETQYHKAIAIVYWPSPEPHIVWVYLVEKHELSRYMWSENTNCLGISSRKIVHIVGVYLVEKHKLSQYIWSDNTNCLGISGRRIVLVYLVRKHKLSGYNWYENTDCLGIFGKKTQIVSA